MAIDMGARPEEQPANRVTALLLIPLVLTLGLVVGIFWVFFQAVRVSGPSMLPNLVEQERVLVTKGYDKPRRGDVVTVSDFPDRGESLIKRVIALPGDTIEIHNDIAYVNGAEESYPFRYEIRILKSQAEYPPARVKGTVVIAGGSGTEEAAITVPADSVYVCGDNRVISLDSRDFGPVPLSDVNGRVFFVFWPLTSYGAIDYGDR